MVATHTRLLTFGAVNRLIVTLPSALGAMETSGGATVNVTMLLVMLPKELVIMV